MISLTRITNLSALRIPVTTLERGNPAPDRQGNFGPGMGARGRASRDPPAPSGTTRRAAGSLDPPVGIHGGKGASAASSRAAA